MDVTSLSQDCPKKHEKTGLRKAVDNHCKWCIYDELDSGTWRFQVANCTMTDCALYQHRPLPIKQSGGNHG